MMHRLRSDRVDDERGQVLVVFVLFLTGLVVLLAFSIDVGAWLSTHRKLQSIADAAALAAVQQGSYGSTLDAQATLDPPDGTWNAQSPPDAVTVTARRPAPLLFGGVAGITALTESASATAQALPPTTLANSDLTQVSGAGIPPWITPIVVNECIFESSCPVPGFDSSACFTPPGCELDFDSADAASRNDSLFGIANVTNAPVDPSTFPDWMTAGSCATDTTCESARVSAGADVPSLRRGTAQPAAVSAMNSTLGKTLLLPVFSVYDSVAGYHLVGFSAFVVTTLSFDGTPPSGNWQFNNETVCGTSCKQLQGYFTQYTLPASPYGPVASSGQPDFGVRAIGLTN